MILWSDLSNTALTTKFSSSRSSGGSPYQKDRISAGCSGIDWKESFLPILQKYFPTKIHISPLMIETASNFLAVHRFNIISVGVFCKFVVGTTTGFAVVLIPPVGFSSK